MLCLHTVVSIQALSLHLLFWYFEEVNSASAVIFDSATEILRPEFPWYPLP